MAQQNSSQLTETSLKSGITFNLWNYKGISSIVIKSQGHVKRYNSSFLITNLLDITRDKGETKYNQRHFAKIVLLLNIKNMH